MIDVKSAVQAARKHADELFADQALQNLLLEEVIFEEDRQLWLITLGYDLPRKVIKRKDGWAVMIRGNESEIEEKQERVYKRFKINAEDGSFQGMEIYNIDC